MFLYKNYQFFNSNNFADAVKGAIRDSFFSTTVSLQYAFRQLNLHSVVQPHHCNFSLVSGDMRGTYRFKTGFHHSVNHLGNYTSNWLVSKLVSSKNITKERQKLLLDRRTWKTIPTNWWKISRDQWIKAKQREFRITHKGDAWRKSLEAALEKRTPENWRIARLNKDLTMSLQITELNYQII